MSNCLITTKTIIELASQVEGETPESIKGLISIWQEKNNKSIEEYPTIDEIKTLLKEIRNKSDKSIDEEEYVPSITNYSDRQRASFDFTPQMRRDRVVLLSRLFSNEVDSIYEEMFNDLNHRIEVVEDIEEKENLRNELDNLTRLSVINKVLPYGIFNRVRSKFKDYVDSSEKERINNEISLIKDTLSKQGNIDKYSDKEINDAAIKKSNYKYEQYKKILDNFDTLAEETVNIISLSEGITINIGNLEAYNTEDREKINSDQEDSIQKEEDKIKEGWMINYRESSTFNSLSQKVRKAISTIPRLNYNGKYDKDDLGFVRYLDGNYVYATLIDSLSNMITSKDMLPLLNKLSKEKIWVKQIIKALEKDDILRSQFYHNFRKDFANYWVQRKTTNSDGTISMKTVSVNRPEGISYLLDSWRDNYQGHILLDKDSIYTNNGSIDSNNASIGLTITNKLIDDLSKLNSQDKIKVIREKDNWNNLVKLLRMIGIDVNQDTLMKSISNLKNTDTITYTDPITIILTKLNTIFSGTSKGSIANNKGEIDLINSFNSVYDSIARLLSEVTDNATESSIRENDKTYYSYVTPSYLGKLVKQLKDIYKDSNRFEEFINKEFKQYEWFFKNGKWRNDWLNQLYSSPKMRGLLDHKVVLNHDKIDYPDLDSLDYTLTLLTEYWSNPVDSRSNTKTAWYHVPILSDSPSAEFIKFRRYTTGDEYDIDGNPMTYKEIILDRLVDLVNQEYDRIMLVRKRSHGVQDGTINPIANYDISYDKKSGKIKNIGGAEFKFLPSLNTYRAENGLTFLDEITRIKNNGSGDELYRFITESLESIMEMEFEKSYKMWDGVGLFEEMGDKYKYLPFSNQKSRNSKMLKSLNLSKGVLGDSWTYEMEKITNDISANKPVEDYVLSRVIEDINSIIGLEFVDPVKHKIIKDGLVINNPAKEALREYFYNSVLATSQIIELTTSDLAFYKNLEDFQKRYKEVHAPSLRLNTSAKFNGVNIGREVERTIYIADEEIVSPSINDIEEIFREHNIHEDKIRDILKSFKKVNVADAQAYRSLSSYRSVMGMSGKWTQDMEDAYNNIINNRWDSKDFDIIWQTIKPYLYTQVGVDSGIEGHTKIKTPVQHKNSEFLLLSMYNTIAGTIGKSKKLKAINEFMEKYNIDVVQFESTVKVGKQGVIDLSSATTESDVTGTLLRATGLNNNNENQNVVHTVSYEDYGIQTETPEHVIDKEQSVGTQIRKLITADMSDDIILDYDDFIKNINKIPSNLVIPELDVTINEIKDKKGITKKQWLTLYNSILVENIIDDYLNTRKLISNPKKLAKLLRDEILNSSRYSKYLLDACTLDYKGEFSLPPYDPIHSDRIQSIINSVIKSRITKQKIKGGSLIQVSDYGLTDDLHIVFEEDKFGKKRIKYLECYMPAYSKDFYEPLMISGTHQLDISKLPDSLRKLVGYRVPTEDKYSMVPLYIKGFLPQQNGSSIMLPSEITTLSGSDFDVDKLYIMLPEFKIQRYDKRRAREDYAKENQLFKDILSRFDKSELMKELLDIDTDNFNKWFNERKDSYLLDKPIIYKVEYDFTKSPEDNSREARNNLFIDLVYSVLTNSDTATKMLNPGGFEELKRISRINTILLNSDISKIKRGLEDIGKPTTDSIKMLLSLDLGTLSDLADNLKTKYNPIAPTTQVYLHGQNMTGAKLIGVYANHNANHALMQHTSLKLKDKNSFTLNGKSLTSLHDVKSSSDNYISRNNAGYLAASVDNVKDPVLALLNQNVFTADISMFLSRLGYEPIEIGLLLQQPIIREITSTYTKESRQGRSRDSIIDSVIKKYSTGIDKNYIPYDIYKNKQFLLEELAKNILDGNSNNKSSSYVENQIAIGMLFKTILEGSDGLSRLTQCTRYDTQNSAAGPSIADNTIRINKMRDFIEDQYNPMFPLENANVIELNIDTSNKKSLRKSLLESKLPFLQAFYTTGLEATSEMFESYFPYYRDSFADVINVIRGFTRSNSLDAKTTNNIYNDLLTYIMTKTNSFGAEVDLVDNRFITSKDKRNKFINEFPADFKKIISNNPDIASLEFIKALKVIKSKNSPVDSIVMKNSGSMNAQLRDSYTRDWEILLYMDNKEANKLAIDLFKYGFFRSGFEFGPQTFIHLAPVSVRLNIPEYISTLKNILNNEDNYSNFVRQYVYNHLNNKRLVPEVNNIPAQFVKDGKVLKEMTVIVDGDSFSAFNQIIKRITNTPEGRKIKFFDFIKKKEGSKWHYYELSKENDNIATYNEITPIGWPNSFLEYEYGKDVEDIDSVISENKLIDSEIETDEVDSIDPESIIESSIKEYDTIIEESIMETAFKEVYKHDIKGDGGNDIFDRDVKDVDFRDADNKEICI